MTFLFAVALLATLLLLTHPVLSFRTMNKVRPFNNGRSLKMIEIQLNTATYVGIAVATMIPSLAFGIHIHPPNLILSKPNLKLTHLYEFLLVKFVGDKADSSRGSLSDKTKEKFKRAMMEQPVIEIPQYIENDIITAPPYDTHSVYIPDSVCTSHTTLSDISDMFF